VARLKSRFGTEGQSYLYQAGLRVRRRGKEDTLQALYHDICRMAGLAFPGKVPFTERLQRQKRLLRQ